MKLIVIAGLAALGGYLFGSLGALVAAGIAGGTIAWLSNRDSTEDKIRKMRRDLGYDENPQAEDEPEDDVAALVKLDLVASVLEAPPEIFALNIPIEKTLENWTPEEISVLKFRVSNFIKSGNLSKHEAALDVLLKRLEPLAPSEFEDIDPEAFKQALLKMYGDK